jgi:hypothetical protein
MKDKKTKVSLIVHFVSTQDSVAKHLFSFFFQLFSASFRGFRGKK